jgi:hypothetical protein
VKILESTEDGYRRTSFKYRDRSRIEEKEAMFRDRGEHTRVEQSGGYYYLYVRKDKPLTAGEATVED